MPFTPALPPSLKNNLAHSLRKLRIPLPARRGILSRLAILPHEDISAQLPAEGKILDIGYGQGVCALVQQYLKKKREIFGCEISLPRLRLARKIRGDVVPKNNPRLTCADGCNLPFVKSAFDGLLLTETAYLIPLTRQCNLAAEMARVCRAGGVCVVCEPVKCPAIGCRFLQLRSRLLTVLSFFPLGNLLFGHRAKGAPFLLTSSEMVSLFQTAGFTVRQQAIITKTFYPHLLLTLQKPR